MRLERVVCEAISEDGAGWQAELVMDDENQEAAVYCRPAGCSSSAGADV